MQKKISKIMQAFAVFPILTANLALAPFGAGAGLPTASVIFPDKNGPLTSEVADNKQHDLEVKAAKVDAYFAQYDLPIASHGKTLVRVAEENDLPWQSLAAVAMIESTGCKFVIPGKNNCFGWGHGKITFKSIDDSILAVGKALGANNDATKHYYDGKSFEEKLITYNGRTANGKSVNPKYVQKVFLVMDRIEKMEVENVLASTSVKADA